MVRQSAHIGLRFDHFRFQALHFVASTRRLLSIVWPFLVIIPVLLLLALASMDILSSVRAYVGGEGLYSKAQKDAIFHLTRYAESRDENEYRQFLTTIAVPLGDAKARRELEKPAPDLEVARQGFVEGRNNPDDIPGMIRLFRYFRRVNYIDRVVAIWAQGDVLIAELCQAAQSLHDHIADSEAGSEQLPAILERIAAINMRLTPLEDEFSYTLGEASRATKLLLLNAIIVIAVLLMVASTMLSRRLLARNEAVQKAQQLTRLNETLELRVRERTTALEATNMRLENEIEARKQAEERIGAALKEKVILLSEIHHRVKNNLQIVHSLLDLQVTQCEDAAVRDILQDSRDRIRSMALIHQSLYQSKNFAQVDIGDVLKKLATNIALSQGLDQRPINIEVQASSVLLSMDSAIPCGLIANELITNALKHGFPDQRAGTVTVSVELVANGAQQILLSVSDNGVGIAADIDLDCVQTLGLELITLLTDQLAGQLLIQRANPTRFVVRFPFQQDAVPKE